MKNDLSSDDISRSGQNKRSSANSAILFPNGKAPNQSTLVQRLEALGGKCENNKQTTVDDAFTCWQAVDLFEELVEALRKANYLIEALADNDLDETIADNGMTVGAKLQYDAPRIAFSNCALLARLSGNCTQVSDKAVRS